MEYFNVGDVFTTSDRVKPSKHDLYTIVSIEDKKTIKIRCHGSSSSNSFTHSRDNLNKNLENGNWKIFKGGDYDIY